MLLATESTEGFTKMLAEFMTDLRPDGAILRQYTEDVARLTWEIRRYREAKAGITNSALLEELRNILQEILPRYDLDVLARKMSIERLARGWFESKNGKAEVLRLFQPFGLDESTVAARAFRARVEDLEMCDRMEARAEARREKTLRFIGEFKQGFGKQLRQSSDRMLDGGDAPNLIPEDSRS